MLLKMSWPWVTLWKAWGVWQKATALSVITSST
jgi:hypothetical protein